MNAPHATRTQTAILRAILTIGHAAGSTQIASVLRGWGVRLSERTVRLRLLELDRLGWTELRSRRAGRVLTDSGRAEATREDVLSRMAFFISGQIDELNYRMDFSLRTRTGTLVVNTTFLPETALGEALETMRPVFAAGLGMGERLAVLRAGETCDDRLGTRVPAGQVALVTVCSVSLNGILLKEGIPVTSRYGGLMEFKNHSPVRFTELLEYGGSTLDPLEMFIRARMTSVARCARTGNGIVGASFREFPSVARPAVLAARRQLQALGLDGIVAIGNPGRPLYGLPVGEGRTGLVLLGGLNPVAALEEAGISNTSRSLSGFLDYTRLLPASSARAGS